MQLYQLLYKSTATEDFKIEFLENFVSEIALKNKKHGITGCLLYDGTHFLQILEGKYTTLSQLMDVIESDQRHTEIVMLLKEPIVEREYINWSMRSVETDASAMTCITSQYEDVANLLSLKRRKDNYLSRADLILNAFLNGEWSNRQLDFIYSFAKPPSKIKSSKLIVENTYPYYFAFQPIIDIVAMEASCIEVLIRGPNGESPENVLGGLDPNELHTLDVDSKMTSLAMMAELEFEGYVSINLLPMSLLEVPYAIERISHQAYKLGIPPDKVVIEITEQELIDNIEKFLELVNLIRVHGMKLAIDDFGAGYAGLSLLANFQPHKIKIDRSIITGVANDGPREAIIESVIHCAHRLGIEVIAEGVENENDLKWLIASGITKFQGYYFAKPKFQALPEINWPKFLTT